MTGYLIAVGVFGGARDVVNERPVPIVDGACELGVLPMTPGVGAVAGDGRAHHPQGVRPDHRTVRVDTGRVRLEFRRRGARRHRALSAVGLLVLGVALFGVRDGRELQPGKRQHEREGCGELL